MNRPHPYLEEWRERCIPDWMQTDLRPEVKQLPAVRKYSSTHTGRAHRTLDSAFRGADWGQAFWPPEKEPPTFWSAAAYWAALVLCVLTFAMLSGCVSEAEADQEVAAWADEPPPPIDNARIEEWVQAAKEANPYLTEHDLSRVRASAMYVEGVRP